MAARLRGIPARAVAVVGVCGALDPSLRPGDVVVATEVRGPEGRSIPCPRAPLLAAEVARLGLRVRERTGGLGRAGRHRRGAWAP